MVDVKVFSAKGVSLVIKGNESPENRLKRVEAVIYLMGSLNCCRICENCLRTQSPPVSLENYSIFRLELRKNDAIHGCRKTENICKQFNSLNLEISSVLLKLISQSCIISIIYNLIRNS